MRMNLRFGRMNILINTEKKIILGWLILIVMEELDLVDFEIWRSYFFDESNWEKIKCVFNNEEFKFNDSICKNDGVSMRCNSKG
jgi:hypothetical protein